MIIKNKSTKSINLIDFYYFCTVKMKFRVVLVCLFTSFFLELSAQNEQFSLSAEIKPRTEFRNGFRKLSAIDTTANFVTTQRSRLNFNYDSKFLKVVFSPQDIRTWGDQDPRSTGGTLQLFNAFAEIALKDNFTTPLDSGHLLLSLKAGRFPIMYDNQRLFAQNDWRQSARSHDAFVMKARKKDLEIDLTAAYNQSSDSNLFGNYYPSSKIGNNYKVLGILWIKKKIGKEFTISSITTADGFDINTTKVQTLFRGTMGGRIEWERKTFYATVSAYLQNGKQWNNKEIQNINAYYFQPEIKYTGLKNWTLRLGAEFFSGDNTLSKTNEINTFVPLYGVAHRFNGNIDFFTQFPKDIQNGGLFNPYLFFLYDVNKKLSIKSDFHAFYNQFAIADANKNLMPLYLGFEQDILLVYKIQNNVKIEFGTSYLTPTASLQEIQKGSFPKTAFWSYFQITATPEFFKIKK